MVSITEQRKGRRGGRIDKLKKRKLVDDNCSMYPIPTSTAKNSHGLIVIANNISLWLADIAVKRKDNIHVTDIEEDVENLMISCISD